MIPKLPASPEGVPDLVVWEDDAGTMHAINADVVVSTKDERTAEVTRHPLESGAQISDHVIQLPDNFVLEIAQSQQPQNEVEGMSYVTTELEYRESQFRPGGLLALSSAAGAAISALAGVAGLNALKVHTLQAGGSLDRVNDLHDQLIGVKQNAIPITVTFKGRIYPDFIVTSIVRTDTKGEVGLTRFTLECEQFQTVETGTAELPDPADLRPRAKKDDGKKPSETLSEAEEAAQKKSLLKQGLDNLF